MLAIQYNLHTVKKKINLFKNSDNLLGSIVYNDPLHAYTMNFRQRIYDGECLALIGMSCKHTLNEEGNNLRIRVT